MTFIPSLKTLNLFFASLILKRSNFAQLLQCPLSTNTRSTRFDARHVLQSEFWLDHLQIFYTEVSRNFASSLNIFTLSREHVKVFLYSKMTESHNPTTVTFRYDMRNFKIIADSWLFFQLSNFSHSSLLHSLWNFLRSSKIFSLSCHIPRVVIWSGPLPHTSRRADSHLSFPYWTFSLSVDSKWSL